MSRRAWDMSSRCFFRVKLLIVILRSSKFPFIMELASGLVLGSPVVLGDFLGTRGTPRVAPIFILSKRPEKSRIEKPPIKLPIIHPLRIKDYIKDSGLLAITH